MKDYAQRRAEVLERVEANHARLGGGKMYRIIGGQAVQVIRHGTELLTVDNPLIAEIPGQQELEYDKHTSTEQE